MPEYTKLLGDAVRRARLELGYTQTQVADRVDIDTRTVLNIENYRGNPKMEVLFPLIRFLKINPNEIFFPELHRDSNEIYQLRLLIEDCSEEEAKDIIPLIQAVLAVLRKKNSMSI